MESAAEPGKEKDEVVVVAVTTGTTVVAGETTLNCLITGAILGEIALTDSWATVETLLIMTILTGPMQPTAIYPYPWHLLHLATMLILKIFFLGPLFLLYISTFLSLTSLLSGGTRLMRLGSRGGLGTGVL